MHRLGVLDSYYLLRSARPYDLVAHRVHKGEKFRIPGPLLRVSSAGTADLAWFLETGRLATQALRDALRLADVELDETGRVLDFGCGCGRVLRHLAETSGPALYGADINGPAVDWCGQYLPIARALKAELEPPLAVPAAHFDVIYAFSVFTHLPPRLAEEWTEELRRILRPGGLLLLSTHGDAYRDQLLPEERATYEAGQIVVRAAASAGSNACGVFHPPLYVRSRMGRGLRFLHLVPEGAKGNPRQDLVIFSRP